MTDKEDLERKYVELHAAAVNNPTSTNEFKIQMVGASLLTLLNKKSIKVDLPTISVQGTSKMLTIPLVGSAKITYESSE